MRNVVVGFILASTVNFVVFNFMYSPKAYSLTKENNELLVKYRLLANKISITNEQLKEIQNRDNGIYRTMFALDTATANFSDSYIFDDYSDIYSANKFSFMLGNLWSDINNLKADLYLQSISLDSINVLAKDKSKMVDAIPTIWPLDRTKLTNSVGAYGYRIHPVYRRRIFHYGVDLTAPTGLPIYATASGTVTFSGRKSGYGNIIIIDHGFGYKTKYAHLKKSHVKNGQKVVRGEFIADLGSTGVVSGPHLHYEVLYKDKHVNPINYLARNMTSEEYEELIQSVKETIYEQ